MLENKNKLKREEELKRSEMKKPHGEAQKMTDKLIENKKKQKLGEIFELMDSDFDGFISAQKIELGGLSPDLIRIFYPLIVEMEEINQGLDKDEFVDASLRLFNVNKITLILLTIDFKYP